jgi:hypothetical protein
VLSGADTADATSDDGWIVQPRARRSTSRAAAREGVVATETTAWAVGAVGLAAAAGLDAPSVNAWASDAVIIAALATAGRLGVAWINRGRRRGRDR